MEEFAPYTFRGDRRPELELNHQLVNACKSKTHIGDLCMMQSLTSLPSRTAAAVTECHPASY